MKEKPSFVCQIEVINKEVSFEIYFEWVLNHIYKISLFMNPSKYWVNFQSNNLKTKIKSKPFVSNYYIRTQLFVLVIILASINLKHMCVAMAVKYFSSFDCIMIDLYILASVPRAREVLWILACSFYSLCTLSYAFCIQLK